jgi:hypothetical protein
MVSPPRTRRVRWIVTCAALIGPLLGSGGLGSGAAVAFGQAPQPEAPRDPAAELAALSAAGFAGDALAWESLAVASRAFAEVDARHTRAAPGDKPRSAIGELFYQSLRGPVWPKGAQTDAEGVVLEELRAAGVFDALDAAAAASALGRPESEFSLSSRFEWSHPIRGITRVLVAEIRRAAHVGDEVRLAVSVRRVLSLTRLLEREPDLLTVGDGTGIRESSLLEIRRIATEYRLGEGVLRFIANEVDRLGPFDGSAMLRAQPIELRTPLDSMFAADGSLNPEAAVAMLRRFSITMNAEGRTDFANREETHRVLAEYFALCDAAAPGNPSDPDPAAAFATPERLERVPALRVAIHFAEILRGDFEWRTRFEYEATRLVLAIAIYESQNVLPPDSLADLDPDDVTPFPRDPWNAETWVYARYNIADRPSRYERFKLYGLGQNRIDDGGAGDDMKIIQARPPSE